MSSSDMSHDAILDRAGPQVNEECVGFADGHGTGK